VPAPAHHPLADPELAARLQRWVGEGLITAETADAIEALELRLRGEVPPPKRVPLVTEGLAYVGGALAAAAAIVVLRDAWEDMAPGVRAAIVAACALATITFGAGLRRSEEPAFARLASLLWLLGTGSAAWLAAIVAADLVGSTDRAAALAATGTASACAAVLYALRPRHLQQLALLSAMVALAVTIADPWPFPTEDRGAGPLAAWGVGAAWLVLGTAGRLRPARTSMVAGAVVALWGPAQFVGSDAEAYGMWLGLGTAILVLGLGVLRREPAVLGLGGLGLFLYLVWVLADRFGTTGGLPLALLVTGALVLVLALVSARRSDRTVRPSPPRSPS